MTLIHTILDAEKKAKENIDSAHTEASLLLSEAEKKASKTLSDQKESLAESKIEIMASNKPELLSIYKKILEVGTARSNEVTEIARRNQRNTVSYIIDNIL